MHIDSLNFIIKFFVETLNFDTGIEIRFILDTPLTMVGMKFVPSSFIHCSWRLSLFCCCFGGRLCLYNLHSNILYGNKHTVNLMVSFSLHINPGYKSCTGNFIFITFHSVRCKIHSLLNTSSHIRLLIRTIYRYIANLVSNPWRLAGIWVAACHGRLSTIQGFVAIMDKSGKQYTAIHRAIICAGVVN